MKKYKLTGEKLYAVSVYETEDDIKLEFSEFNQTEKESGDMFKDEVWLDVPLFMSSTYSTEHINYSELEEWFNVTKQLQCFYTLDYNLAVENYNYKRQKLILSMSHDIQTLNKKINIVQGLKKMEGY